MAHRHEMFKFNSGVGKFQCSFCGTLMVRASTKRHINACKSFKYSQARKVAKKVKRQINNLHYDGKVSMVGRRLVRVGTHHQVEELVENSSTILDIFIRQICLQKFTDVESRFFQQQIISYFPANYVKD